MSLGEALPPRVRATIEDTLLLKRAERMAAGYPPAGQDKMRELCRAAADRARVADDIVEGHAASALALYREAAVLYAAALVTVRKGDTLSAPLRAEEVIARFKELDAGDLPAREREQAETFLAAAVEPDLLAADRLDTPRAVALGYEARRAVRRLASFIEPRKVSEIRFTRYGRVGAVAVVALALLVYVASTFGERENVALHKLVTASGIYPGVAPPAGLTDGVKTGRFGVHTNVGDAWVQVDLDGVYEIDSVKIYNRGDCCFTEGLPMVLQCSENGKDFVELETRTTTFSQSDPWVAKAGHKACRYLKLIPPKGRYVTLTELEVFGDKK